MCMRYNFWMCQSLTSMCQTWESGRDQFWHGMHQGEESPLASLQVIPNNWSCNAGVRASYNPTLIALEKVRRWVMHSICQSNRRLIIHKHRLWILFSLFWYLASVGRPPWSLVGTERGWGEKRVIDSMVDIISMGRWSGRAAVSISHAPPDESGLFFPCFNHSSRWSNQSCRTAETALSRAQEKRECIIQWAKGRGHGWVRWIYI